jgi:hypothetical protein
MNAINCAEMCANGCILGDQCPHLEYLKTAQKFIAEKSIDQLLQIAASRFDPPAPELTEPDFKETQDR